jgi:hypothetical protein
LSCRAIGERLALRESGLLCVATAFLPNIFAFGRCWLHRRAQATRADLFGHAKVRPPLPQITVAGIDSV